MDQVKQKYVKQFKQLYRDKTGTELSDMEALMAFEKLTVLVKAVYRPIPQDS